MDGIESEQTEGERTSAIFDASLRDYLARYQEVYGDIDSDTLLLIRKVGLKILSYSNAELQKTATILDTGINTSSDDEVFLGTGKDETDVRLGRDERQTFAHTTLLGMYQLDIETTGEEFALSVLRDHVADRLFRLEFLREAYQDGRYKEVRYEPRYRESSGLLRSTLNDTYTTLHASQSQPSTPHSE